MKGSKSCTSKHIDDDILYQAFVGAFNIMVENKDYFIEKWQESLGSDNLLKRYKVKQFIEIITESEPISDFDVDLYFMLVEKMTVFDGGRSIVSLLDGKMIECQVE